MSNFPRKPVGLMGARAPYRRGVYDAVSAASLAAGPQPTSSVKLRLYVIPKPALNRPIGRHL